MYVVIRNDELARSHFNGPVVYGPFASRRIASVWADGFLCGVACEIVPFMQPSEQVVEEITAHVNFSVGEQT